MIRLITVIMFFAVVNPLMAQHIRYVDKTKPPPNQEVTNIQNAPKDSAEIITPHNECPGMDASLPVAMNYVPPEIINKFRIKFEGHLYCITTIKISDIETQYKLRICYKGEFVERYVNTEGKIVR